MSTPWRSSICALPIERQVSAYFATSTWATIASVGRPPSISRAGAGACTTASSHARQAYFGRRVTSTRYCAGITSSRCEVSRRSHASRPAAGTVGVFRLDRHIHARQMGGKRAATGTTLFGTCLGGRRILLVARRPRRRQLLARYPRVPAAAARDRASPNAGRTAPAATGAIDAAGDRFATAPGRAPQSRRHAPHAPPRPAHAALRCR